MKFDTRALKKDINLYLNTFAKTYVTEAIRELENKANECVAYFYDDYEPVIYQRTFQFLDNGVTSKTWKTKGGYAGYVDLMSDVSGGNMIYVSDELTDEAIREENWCGGRFKAKETSPSPVFYLMDFYYGKNFNNSAIEKAKFIARNQPYSCIKKG